MVSKFIKRGTNKENVWEHGNIGQFWEGTREQVSPSEALNVVLQLTSALAKELGIIHHRASLNSLIAKVKGKSYMSIKGPPSRSLSGFRRKKQLKEWPPPPPLSWSGCKSFVGFSSAVCHGTNYTSVYRMMTWNELFWPRKHDMKR